MLARDDSLVIGSPTSRRWCRNVLEQFWAHRASRANVPNSRKTRGGLRIGRERSKHRRRTSTCHRLGPMDCPENSMYAMADNGPGPSHDGDVYDGILRCTERNPGKSDRFCAPTVKLLTYPGEEWIIPICRRARYRREAPEKTFSCRHRAGNCEERSSRCGARSKLRLECATLAGHR